MEALILLRVQKRIVFFRIDCRKAFIQFPIPILRQRAVQILILLQYICLIHPIAKEPYFFRVPFLQTAILRTTISGRWLKIFSALPCIFITAGDNVCFPLRMLPKAGMERIWGRNAHRGHIPMRQRMLRPYEPTSIKRREGCSRLYGNKLQIF